MTPTPDANPSPSPITLYRNLDIEYKTRQDDEGNIVIIQAFCSDPGVIVDIIGGVQLTVKFDHSVSNTQKTKVKIPVLTPVLLDCGD